MALMRSWRARGVASTTTMIANQSAKWLKSQWCKREEDEIDACTSAGCQFA